ncbi:MAG: hypothetical protein ACQEVA_02165 [Myxococcota bacterium]
MRLFQTRHRLLGSVLVVAALAGCFPKNGKPYSAGPATLLQDARHACQRHDTQAHRMLLERLIRQYPDSDEAYLARQQLEKERTTDGGCS